MTAMPSWVKGEPGTAPGFISSSVFETVDYFLGAHGLDKSDPTDAWLADSLLQLYIKLNITMDCIAAQARGYRLYGETDNAGAEASVGLLSRWKDATVLIETGEDDVPRFNVSAADSGQDQANIPLNVFGLYVACASPSCPQFGLKEYLRLKEIGLTMVHFWIRAYGEELLGDLEAKPIGISASHGQVAARAQPTPPPTGQQSRHDDVTAPSALYLQPNRPPQALHLEHIPHLARNQVNSKGDRVGPVVNRTCDYTNCDRYGIVKFQGWAALERHYMEAHDDSYPYLCDKPLENHLQCPASFSDIGAYNNHLKEVRHWYLK
ncbi:hypothetical protein BJ508DRAFT_314269 [Ascobolus immersus RN42]|uniref:Uncharacterized protein n=1 Tax=Ascobolus immersus RN42 TaxID=1160509 RepID=A0A3N4HFN4_ASCIM|nr:hypothetical protein BJ508DRAFT_314269 [Ascobolus immersus RN42]